MKVDAFWLMNHRKEAIAKKIVRNINVPCIKNLFLILKAKLTNKIIKIKVWITRFISGKDNYFPPS